MILVSMVPGVWSVSGLRTIVITSGVAVTRFGEGAGEWVNRWCYGTSMSRREDT